MDIYPKKDLSVVLDPSQLGVADGYEITSISFMPPTITVAAEPDLLEDLEHLPLKIPDKLKNASPTKSFTETLSFSNLSEFKYVSSKQVYMTVTISEIQDTNLLSDIPVKTFGLPDGLTGDAVRRPLLRAGHRPAFAGSRAGKWRCVRLRRSDGAERRNL